MKGLRSSVLPHQTKDSVLSAHLHVAGEIDSSWAGVVNETYDGGDVFGSDATNAFCFQPHVYYAMLQGWVVVC